MNRRQIGVLLRHRDRSGNLDWDLLKAAQRERHKDKGEPPADRFETLRSVRRLQGWPEYLIDDMLRKMKGVGDATDSRTIR